jgi:hypothetical protein
MVLDSPIGATTPDSPFWSQFAGCPIGNCVV